MENENPYENTPVEEIPFEDMSIEELDTMIDETTPLLEFELLEDILEVMQYGYVLGWLIFALLFFILIFVAIGSGKK
ncbi:hypothetical protein [Psychrobacillus sp. FSL H8-0487]|uniref:hypothetical protein n=1 Tax=Psychrobacillus sp. FSL H8-0487 TaxID=2921391 RepID=UPI0030F76EDF